MRELHHQLGFAFGEVRDFQQDLRACTENALTGSQDQGYSEAKFLEVKRTIEEGKICVEGVPPEEFLIDRNARDIESAAFVGHRKMATVAELIEMGYSEDQINEYISSSDFEANWYQEAETTCIVII